MSKVLSKSARVSGWSGRRGSLRTQLIAWNILALALLLGVLGVIIRYTVLSFLMAPVDRDLERQVEHIPPPPPDGFGHGGGPGRGPFGMGPGSMPEQGPQSFPGGQPPNDFPGRHGPDGGPGRHGPPGWREDSEYRPHEFDLDGHSVMPSDTRAVWDAAGLAFAKRGEMHYANIVVDGEPLRVLSAPVRDQGGRGEVVSLVQVAYPLSEIDRAIAGLNSALLTLIPVGLLGAGLGGAYLTDRVLRRVRRTTQAAEHISAQDFSARLPVTGNDEFSELSETFNGLLGRLESAYQQQERLLEQQRRFTADASHELKTPLTIIKGTASMVLSGHPAETVYRSSLQEIDRAADTMSHLVQDLLLLARSDGGQLGKNPIELLVRELLERAISGMAPGGAHITLRVEEEALSVVGNETELVRLFSNILENATRYTPPEGAICVIAQAEGENVLVSVADMGIGIAPEHLPHLGERFYRVDSSRSRPDGGTGLGLSICKSILDAHHGTMTFESVPGKGTTVRILLPRPH